ncbi:MAG: sulfatase [Halobacteriaceae archaeon]
MAADSRPNVVFMFSDQHRGMDVGYAGNPDVRTPNMDRLATEGMALPRTYANTPLCCPSRATLLTGQYPMSHTVIGNPLQLPTDVPSVGEAFRDAGYRTGYVGKWHLDGRPLDGFTPPGPRRQGFDDFWAVYNCSHDYFDAEYYRDDPTPIEFDGYAPAGYTDLALEFLEDSDTPFCLFLSWAPPHGPYDQVPDEYKNLYDAAELEMRPNTEPFFEFARERGFDDPRETVANYYAHITALDDQLGRLLDCLDEAGLAEDTIVVYTSDHGDMLFSQGYMKKEAPWEESINVPFVVRWPGEIPADTVDESLFSVVDMAPTVLSLAGVSPPAEMEGTDYAPVLRGEGASLPDSVFLTLPVPNNQAQAQGIPEWRGVRTDRYTYVRLQDGTPWLLYDNEDDPYQLQNLALQNDARAMREELDETLDDWLARRDDEFLSAEAHLRDLGRAEEL